MIEALHLGVEHVAAAAPDVATAGVDLTTVLASFGVSAPLFVWLLAMHRTLIKVVIPRGFRLIRKEIRRQGEESAHRHQEHMADLHVIRMAMVREKKGKARKTKRQVQRRGVPTPSKAARHPRKKLKRPKA